MTQTRPDASDRVERRAGDAGTLRRRIIGMVVFGACFVAWTLIIGLPTDPLIALVWLFALTIAWNNHRRWTTHLRFVRDWLPVLVFLIVYTYSRGWVYTPSTVPHVYEMVTLDRAIFGVSPTVWLQQHLYNPHRVYPWDIAVSLVYFSHFVTVYLVAAVLWLRNRPMWAAFMRRWMVLTFAGLTTYLLYPAAPPWWAAQYGLMGPVARISSRGWNAIGLHTATNMLNHAQLNANPVAAMPSLHFAFSLCVATFFATRVRRRWIPLLALYPAAMGFTLAYTGEHHVSDMIAGALYVVAAFAVVAAGERTVRRYRARRLATALAAGPEPATPTRAEPGPAEPAPASPPPAARLADQP